VLVLMLAAACGGAPTAPSSPAAAAPATSAPSLSAVAITGTAPMVGGTAQFSAAATLTDGTSQPVTTQAAWSSSNPAIASVSLSGLVTGVGAGDADITAAYQGVSGKMRITIAQPIITVCSYALSIGSTIDGYPNGGTFPVTVSAPNGCGWTASTPTPWIHLPVPASGNGSGTLTFTADANVGAARSGTLVIAGRTVVFNQTAAAPVPSPNPVFAGIRYDNIQFPHTFIVGSPVPTQNQAGTYCCWPLPVRNSGAFTYRLSDFPLDVLPSGGSSNVASPSEMLLVGINISPASAVMRFEWHKAVGQDSVIYAFTTASFIWAYSFIGHFSWEINEPGLYYLLIDTPSGSARMDFAITGSAPTLTGLRTVPPANAWRVQAGGARVPVP
jgi:hypothetical protein